MLLYHILKIFLVKVLLLNKKQASNKRIYNHIMLALLVPPIMSDSNMRKLPKELAIIISYATIRDLLNSSEGEYENIFNETKMQFLKYSALVGMTLKDKDIKRLVNIYSSSLSQLEELAQRGDPVILALTNANDMIADFSRLIFPSIETFLPQYTDAFEPYLDLLVSCTVLLQVNENKNTNQRNISKLTQRCQENIWKLEGYIDTIEIETDPKQRAILERITGQ